MAVHHHDSGDSGVGIGMVLGVILAILLVLLLVWFAFGADLTGTRSEAPANDGPDITIEQPEPKPGGVQPDQVVPTQPSAPAPKPAG